MKDRGAQGSRASQRDRKVRIVVVCAVFVLSAVQLWSQSRSVPSDTDAAERFVVALNAGNLQAMVSASGYPFVFRNQEWESAKDGSGFIHGKAEDKVLAKRTSLRKFLGGMVGKVKIESEKAAASPPPKDSLLADNLKGASPTWKELNLFVFFRGSGDVEHVAIIGVDSTHHKVQGVYLN